MDYEQTTETHLSKKYNDVVFEALFSCSVTARNCKTVPHYENLVAYASSVEVLYTSTSFLFEHIPVVIDDKNYIMGDWLDNTLTQINKYIIECREGKHGNKAEESLLYKNINLCILTHRIILRGLQARKMLVRVSDREPVGRESIQHWDTKTGFRKGGLPGD
jgi:hypothetical protein